MISYFLFVILFVNFMMFYFYSYLFMKILILVEFVVLTVMMVYLFVGSGPLYFLIYILILGVCDGVLGLGILVLFFRFYGLDLIKWNNLIF